MDPEVADTLNGWLIAMTKDKLSTLEMSESQKPRTAMAQDKEMDSPSAHQPVWYCLQVDKRSWNLF